MALTWAGRRQLVYLSIIVAAGLIVAAIFAYPYLTVKSTCNDLKQNGDEAGIDCGGACARYCPNQLGSPIVLWSRVFPVTENIYNAVAYIENQNPTAGIRNIGYTFKIYDDRNVFIVERSGETFIPPNGRSAIFEPMIDAGKRKPFRTSFSFTGAAVWYKIDPRTNALAVFVRDQLLENEKISPKLSATVSNSSIYDLSDLDVIAILSDKDGNAVVASKTFLDTLGANSEKTVYFTWPRPITADISKIEILPKINVFNIRF